VIERLQAKRNEEGFTLIELLIVIIVLGILAAIVVFAVSGTRKDAVASRCKTDVKSIQLSEEAVFAKSGAYSAADAQTVAPTNGALLKEWPSTADYVLKWDGTGVDVYKKDGTTAATCDTLS
jgi:prepilin-type N-terminal cleavage/methylation domain-containing protein